MKKQLALLAAALCALALVNGCNQRNDAVDNTVHATELKTMQQSYRGILPCADCAEIETSLFLEQDGSWVMNERYQGAITSTMYASYGAWSRTADKLVLTDSQGDKRYFLAKDDGLVMLDRNGNLIASKFNYALKATDAELPTAPMAMTGMYFYMADSAIFTDCATGKKTRVTNNAQLERDFSLTRGDREGAVLLHIKGHFIREANMDSGVMIKMLTPDEPGKFVASQHCPEVK